MPTPIEEAQLQKVQVMLHEYDTLRNEILQKSSGTLQGASILADIVAVLLSNMLNQQRKRIHYILLSIIVTAYVFGLWYYADKPTGEISAHIREIEANINQQLGGGQP